MEKTDPRVIKTLRQIDAALLDSLKQMPFQKITVEVLCRTAMINRSTFYKYYIDKYDLLDKYLERILSEFKEHANVDFINAVPANIQDSTYMKYYKSTLEFIFSKKDEYLILWHAAIDRQIYNEMTGIIHDNIIATLDKESADGPEKKRYADLYAYLFASNMMSLVHWWFKNPDTVSQKEVEEIMTSNMKLGLFKTFKKQMER